MKHICVHVKTFSLHAQKQVRIMQQYRLLDGARLGCGVGKQSVTAYNQYNTMILPTDSLRIAAFGSCLSPCCS